MARAVVVIGNYEGSQHLAPCLEAVVAQTLPALETIVVDAGSSDASVSIARDFGARVISVANLGLGFLYNRGAEATSAEFVLFANNDVALDPDCLARLVDALVADSSRFAADPTQLDWSGERVIHARTLLRRGSLVRTPIPGLVIDPLVLADTVVSTLCANAGAMLVRHSMFDELGGFDESYFLDFEDLELCWRAWSRGWPSVYVPEARLRHRVGASEGPTLSSRRQRSAHHNLVRFALECLPGGALARVLVGELARLARRPRTIVPALLRVGREAPEIIARRRAIRGQREMLERLLGLDDT